MIKIHSLLETKKHKQTKTKKDIKTLKSKWDKFGERN